MSTEDRRVSSLQERANRFDLVSRLADDLAHEIKNPLHAMVINLELVKRRVATGDTATALERADVVGAEALRVNELLDLLLQLLRPMRQTGPVLDVDAALRELLPLLEVQARLSGVELGYSPPGRGVGVRIRKDALKHVVLNLMANALEALREEEGGRIDLSVEVERAGVRLRVADTGPGLPAEVVERFGEAGAGARATHAGLGLSVARGLVEEAGGELRVEWPGGDGRGAVLSAWLPAFRRLDPSSGAGLG